MSSNEALAAHLGWQLFEHRPDCAEPAWQVDRQTEADKLRPGRRSRKHRCDSEGCLHHDRCDRITVRVLCRSCGVVHVISGEEYSIQTTNTASTGYGQPPRKAGGLWLYPGPQLSDWQDAGPGAYLCSREKVDWLVEEDVVGALVAGRGRRGAAVWRAATDPTFHPPVGGLPGYAKWAKPSKPFSTVTAAAEWLTAELEAAAANETCESNQ